MSLKKGDTHYWGPVKEVAAFLFSGIDKDAKVLDIGPGTMPFRRADTYIDFTANTKVEPEKLVICDVAKDRLPFPDKSFDFVHCRHVLEDMWNPFFLIGEMSRVGKAGYIETPSPIAEMCRGVDGKSPVYRGYYHHRFFVWDEGGTLTFVTKYPLVEYVVADEERLGFLLRLGPRYWNTYFMWTDEIKVVHKQSPLDFDVMRGYPKLLTEACDASKKATDAFLAGITTTTTRLAS